MFLTRNIPFVQTWRSWSVRLNQQKYHIVSGPWNCLFQCITKARGTYNDLDGGRILLFTSWKTFFNSKILLFPTIVYDAATTSAQSTSCASQNLYNSSLLNDEAAIAALGSKVEEVVSLDEIYNVLKEYDTDERVYEYLRKIENSRIEYLFTDLSFDKY